MNYNDLGVNLEWIKKLLFTGVFIQENKLHAAYDRYGEITCKQWLLLAIISPLDYEPDLTEIGNAMGCSRQNVKQLALSLEKKGLLELKKTEKDSRSLFIFKTPKYYEVSTQNDIIGKGALDALFSEFKEEEIKQYYELSKKLLKGIENVNEYFDKMEK